MRKADDPLNNTKGSEINRTKFGLDSCGFVDRAFAFLTLTFCHRRGVGSETGTVEIIDLAALKTGATVDVGQEAAGVDFYKTEPPK